MEDQIREREGRRPSIPFCILIVLLNFHKLFFTFCLLLFSEFEGGQALMEEEDRRQQQVQKEKKKSEFEGEWDWMEGEKMLKQIGIREMDACVYVYVKRSVCICLCVWLKNESFSSHESQACRKWATSTSDLSVSWIEVSVSGSSLCVWTYGSSLCVCVYMADLCVWMMAVLCVNLCVRNGDWECLVKWNFSDIEETETEINAISDLMSDLGNTSLLSYTLLHIPTHTLPLFLPSLSSSSTLLLSHPLLINSRHGAGDTKGALRCHWGSDEWGRRGDNDGVDWAGEGALLCHVCMLPVLAVDILLL